MVRLIPFYMIFWLLISCNDSSPIIEGEESDSLPLTKQDSLKLQADSVSLAQKSLRDSLINIENWYAINTFGFLSEQYNYAILVPKDIDTSIVSHGWFPNLIWFDFYENEKRIRGGHPCYSDTPGDRCIERFNTTNYPDGTELIINAGDTIGFFFNTFSEEDNKGIFRLHLPLTYDLNTLGLAYNIWYDPELEDVARTIARSAHKFR